MMMITLLLLRVVDRESVLYAVYVRGGCVLLLMMLWLW